MQETLIRNEFEAQFIDKSGDVESMWKSLEADLLESGDIVCGWTKGPPSHGGGMTLLLPPLKKSVQLGNGGSKNEYLHAKKVAKRAVYDARRVAEWVRFGEILREDNRTGVQNNKAYVCN